MAERPLLGEVLVQAGLIDDLQLARALGEQKRWGGRLGLALLRLGFVAEDELLRTLSNQLGVPAVRLGGKRVASEVLVLLPAELAEKYRCIPLFVKREAGRELLHLGMEDPTDLAAIDDVSFRTGRRVRPVLIGPDELRRCLARFYREGEPAEGDEAVPGSEEPPEATSTPDLPARREPLAPPDDPTIVATSPAVSAPEEPTSPVFQDDVEPDEDGDLDIVPEETLAQGMDMAAAESGATTSFGRMDDVPTPQWVDDEPAVAAPPESEVPADAAPDWTDDEPMSETDLPSAISSSTLLEELDPGDALDIEAGDDEAGDDEAGAAAPESDGLEPEDLSSRHLSHPKSLAPPPIPPEDPQDSAMLLPLEDEVEEPEAAPPAGFDAPELGSVDETCLFTDLGVAEEASCDEDGLEVASSPDADLAVGDGDAASEAAMPASDEALDAESVPAAFADEVEPCAAPVAATEPPAISTRDVLRALTELLVEKGILEPPELLERVRASRATDESS